jgi:hypothetical protein
MIQEDYRMPSKHIRVRELSSVFGATSPSNFNAKMARLAVLYEDLRIELHGIAEDSIPAMDKFDVRYRRIYFLRKSIGTLSEFAEAVRHLQQCPEFRFTSSSSSLPLADTERAKLWHKAARFFERNEERLKAIRNDIGGHFGLEAARYASVNFGPTAVMGLEIEERNMSLNFAGEIVATAMLRHATGLNQEHKTTRLSRLARIGYRRATTCVHCVVAYHLWDRFG